MIEIKFLEFAGIFSIGILYYWFNKLNQQNERAPAAFPRNHARPIGMSTIPF